MALAWSPVLLAQQASGLFVEVAPSAARAADQRVVPDRTRIRSRTVRIDFPRLGSRDAGPGAGETVRLNLFENVSYVAVRDRIDSTPRGFVWVGHIPGVEMSTVTLATESGVLSGSILTPDAAYAVRSAGDGLHSILQVDQGAFPPEAEPQPGRLAPSPAPDATETPDGPQGDSASLIDVMVLYTPAAAAAAGGTAAINVRIASAISITNTSYINSSVVQRLRLVHSQAVAYTESGDIQVDLTNITSGVGSLSGVAALRNYYAADLVTLLTETPAFQWCGVAWAMTTVSTQFASHGFNVVEQRCAVEPLSFAHELGHNMGLRHDWYLDNGSSPYSYAHGHVNAGDTQAAQWRTIMAYGDKCADQGKFCPRLTYWSNPSITYLGTPMGVPAGTSVGCSPGNPSNPPCDADEHQALNNSAFAVANFRQSALAVVSLTANVALPAVEGTAITWTATASGGSGPLLYQFFRLTDDVWSEAQPYGPGNSYTWFPSAGTHALEVHVKSTGSSAAFDGAMNTGTFTIVAPVPTLTSFTASVAFPVQWNVPITFRAAAAGGSAPLEYKFLTYSTASGWAVARDYSPSNAFTWFPPQGQNAVQVWMRAAGSTESYQGWQGIGPFNVGGTPVTLTAVSADVSFPAAATTPITWTASASGGAWALEYKFVRYNVAADTWSVLRDWSGSNQATWTPGAANAGWHVVQVWVRTAGSSVPYEDWRSVDYFLVMAPQLTLTPDRSLSGMTVGDLATWTATVFAPGAWEYRLFSYDSTRGWLSQSDYSPQNTFTWFPPAGTCAVQVWVRRAGSGAAWEHYESTGYFIVNP